MRLIKKIYILLLLSSTFSTALIAQNKNEVTEKRERITIDMKEFDDHSFKNAMPTNIKDSSILFQHLVGIKYGYSISNLTFNQDIRTKSINNPINVGIYYTYLHSLWESMPFFGIQIGAEYTGLGTKVYFGDKENETEVIYSYKSYLFPLTTQIRTDFNRFRLMLNAGGFAYYLTSNTEGGEIPSTTQKLGYGLTGGGGIAIKFKPVEIHLECNYRYALSNLLSPTIYSEEYWVYTHANQLQVSVGLFYNFNLNKKRKK